MALKNRDDISEFGKRLYGLIADMDNRADNVEDMIRSPKGLAKKLYDQGLVHVNTKENFNSDYVNYNNAINSIEKKIVRHINTGVIKDQQGEFVLAYCRFFNCSSDYILGLSEVKSVNPTVRGICEATGLSETVVNQLMRTNKGDDSYINEMWNALLESSLFEELPHQWNRYAEQLIELYTNESDLRTREWEMEHRKNSRLIESIKRSLEETEAKVKVNRNTCDGILYTINRKLIDVIEKKTRRELTEVKKEIYEDENKIGELVVRDGHYQIVYDT